MGFAQRVGEAKDEAVRVSIHLTDFDEALNRHTPGSQAAHHGWRYLPALPVVFATIHVSWGLGFLWSLLRTLLVKRALRWPPTSQATLEQ